MCLIAYKITAFGSFPPEAVEIVEKFCPNCFINILQFAEFCFLLRHYRGHDVLIDQNVSLMVYSELFLRQTPSGPAQTVRLREVSGL